MNNLAFSVDSSAHLRKIVESTFSEKEYYLVELIRTAVKRGATEINVSINSRKVVIKDNGRGVECEFIDKFINMYNNLENISDRDDHIDSFTKNNRLGLLSVFTPEPSSIILKTNLKEIHNEGKNGLAVFLSGNQVTQRLIELKQFGTEIQLVREGGNRKAEEEVLMKYLTRTEISVPFKVILNGKKIEFKGSLSKSVIKDQFETNSGRNVILGIPIQGEICRVCVTENGIPWFVEMYYPIKGCVFDVVVETPSDLEHSDYSLFIKKVLNLYSWMGDNYIRLPKSHQTRLRELIHLYLEKNRESELFKNVKIYKTTGGELFTLDNIVKFSETSSLSVIDYSEYEKGDFFPDEQIFVMNDKDIYYIGNTLKVSLNRKDTSVETLRGWLRAKQKLSELKVSVFNIFDRLFEKKINLQDTKEEKLFKNSLSVLFKGIFDVVEFTGQNGFSCCHKKRKNKSRILCIHLNHPATQTLIKLMVENNDYRIMAWHLYSGNKERRGNVRVRL